MDRYAIVGLAVVSAALLSLMIFWYLSWRSAGRAKVDPGYLDDESAPFDKPASLHPMRDQYLRMLDPDSRPAGTDRDRWL